MFVFDLHLLVITLLLTFTLKRCLHLHLGLRIEVCASLMESGTTTNVHNDRARSAGVGRGPPRAIPNHQKCKKLVGHRRWASAHEITAAAATSATYHPHSHRPNLQPLTPTRRA